MGWEGRGKGWYSLHKKQDLWKLLPSHCTSSAKYTAFWQTPHFFPPPQFGILQKKHRQKQHQDGRSGRALAGQEAGTGQSEAARAGTHQQCSSSRSASAHAETTHRCLLFAQIHNYQGW